MANLTQTKRIYLIVLTRYHILLCNLEVTFHSFNCCSTHDLSLSLKSVSSSINIFGFSFFVHASFLRNYQVLSNTVTSFNYSLKNTFLICEFHLQLGQYTITGLDWTTGLPLELEVLHYNNILVLICSLM